MRYYLDFNDYKNWDKKEGGTRIENMNDFYNEFVVNEGYINRKYKFYRLD